MIFSCGVSMFLISRTSSPIACSIGIMVIACVTFVHHRMVAFFVLVISLMHKHSIMLMHTSHSCIIVTETPESEPVEPAESVEPEPGVEFLVELKENQGKPLSMIPCTYLNWVNLVISFGYLWIMYIMLSIAFFYLSLCINLPWDYFILVLVTC